MNTKALEMMIDVIPPALRATTMCASAAQTEALITEIKRLTSVIENLQAARGGELMAEAKEIAERGAFPSADLSSVADKLCTAILELHCDTADMGATHALSCKLGHRTARYAAAELVRAHLERIDRAAPPAVQGAESNSEGTK